MATPSTKQAFTDADAHPLDQASKILRDMQGVCEVAISRVPDGTAKLTANICHPSLEEDSLTMLCTTSPIAQDGRFCASLSFTGPKIERMEKVLMDVFRASAGKPGLTLAARLRQVAREAQSLISFAAKSREHLAYRDSVMAHVPTGRTRFFSDYFEFVHGRLHLKGTVEEGVLWRLTGQAVYDRVEQIMIDQAAILEEPEDEALCEADPSPLGECGEYFPDYYEFEASPRGRVVKRVGVLANQLDCASPIHAFAKLSSSKDPITSDFWVEFVETFWNVIGGSYPAEWDAFCRGCEATRDDGVGVSARVRG
jgi:hypothetical protein